MTLCLTTTLHSVEENLILRPFALNIDTKVLYSVCTIHRKFKLSQEQKKVCTRTHSTLQTCVRLGKSKRQTAKDKGTTSSDSQHVYYVVHSYFTEGPVKINVGCSEPLLYSLLSF